MSPLIHVVEDDRDHRVALCDLIEAAGHRAEEPRSRTSYQASQITAHDVVAF